jgi:hypothetical protein
MKRTLCDVRAHFLHIRRRDTIRPELRRFPCGVMLELQKLQATPAPKISPEHTWPLAEVVCALNVVVLHSAGEHDQYGAIVLKDHAPEVIDR